VFDLSEIPISQFRKVLFLFKKKSSEGCWRIFLSWITASFVFLRHYFLMCCKMGLITWSWCIVKSVKNKKNWIYFVYVNVSYICFLAQHAHETPLYFVIMWRRNCVVCRSRGRWISFQTILWFLLWILLLPQVSVTHCQCQPRKKKWLGNLGSQD
jgi:hypothetical protein